MRQKPASYSRSAASTCRARSAESPRDTRAIARRNRARSIADRAGRSSGCAIKNDSPTTSVSAIGSRTSATSAVDISLIGIYGKVSTLTRGYPSVEHAQVDGGKERCAGLTDGDALRVERAMVHGVAELPAGAQVVRGSSGGVVDRGAARHHERPVAGLRQEQLAERLDERPTGQRIARRRTAQCNQPIGGRIQLPIHPVVRASQPDRVVSPPAPR